MLNEKTQNKLRNTIADRVRTLRKAAGLTQEQLAEKAGIGPEHLSKIETSTRLPSLDALVGLAFAMHVEPADLIGGIAGDQQTDRADRLDAALTTLCDEDAEFIESEVLNWVARLRRARG